MADLDSTPRLCAVCGASILDRRFPLSPCCSTVCRRVRRKLYERSWNNANADKRKAQKAARYADRFAENPEAVREYQRQWCAKNPEKRRKYREKQAPKMNAYSRRSYEKHRNAVLEKGRQRTASGESRVAGKKSYIKHLEQQRARCRKKALARRAIQRGAFAEHVDPSVVFSRAKGICGICHKVIIVTDKWHVDHIEPLAKGGAHSYDNVQPAHAACNISKGAKLSKGQGLLFRRAG